MEKGFGRSLIEEARPLNLKICIMFPSAQRASGWRRENIFNKKPLLIPKEIIF